VAARYLLNRRLNTCIAGVWDGLIRFFWLKQTTAGGASSWTDSQHLPGEPEGRGQNEKNSKDFEHIYCQLTG